MPVAKAAVGPARSGSRPKRRSSAKHGKRAPADRRRADFWLGHLLNLSGGILRQRIGQALGPFGISPRAFGLLLEIGRGEGHRQVEIARRLGFDRTTMSQLVEDLRARDWIERDMLADDRRVNTLRLTERGEKLLPEVIAASKSVEDQFASCLDARTVKALRAALQALLAHAREEVGEAPRRARPRTPG